ncbi:hypothetical protein BLA29_015118, partial [Euroglyphus maynei]
LTDLTQIVPQLTDLTQQILVPQLTDLTHITVSFSIT